MKVTQKVLISLLVATVLFTAFAIAAFSGLYDLIDTRFYDQRVRDAGYSLLTQAQEVTLRYQEGIRDEIVALVDLPAIRNVFLINQSRQDTEEQTRAIGALFDRRPEIEFLRIYDNEAGELWFSTLEEDVRSRSEVRIEYRPTEELEPAVDLPAPEDEGSIVSWHPDRSAIRVVVPVVDAFEIPRGVLVAWVRLTGLYSQLVEENLVGPSARVRMSLGGILVYNARRHFVEEDLATIDRVISDAETLPLLRSDLGESYAIEYREPESSALPPGVLLISENDLHMDRGLRIILLAAVFVVGFLLSYLILNLRQEPAVVVSERFRRFQQAVLRDYLREGRAIQPELWKRELDGRREQIEGELKRGIGRLNDERRTAVEHEMGRRWEELYRLIGTQTSAKTELEQVSLAQIEAIIERTLARHGSAPIAGAAQSARPVQPSPKRSHGEPAGPHPVDDELEPLEEIEEIGEAEEIEEELVADEGPFAGMRPVEVESVEEGDFEEIEEIGEAEELEAEPEGAEVVEELSEVEDILEAEEAPVAEEGPFAGMRPVEVESVEEGDLEEIEEIGEAEELEAEPEGAEVVEELSEVEDILEAEEAPVAEEGPFAGMRPVEVESVEEGGLEEIEEIDEAEELEAEPEGAEVVEELEAEDLEEVDELSEVEDIPEAEEEPVVEEGPFAGMRPVEVDSIEEGDLEEIEEIGEAEELEAEPEGAEVVEELEAEDLEEVDELSEVEDIPEAEEEPVVEEGPFAGMRPVEVDSIEEGDLEEIEEIGEAEELEAEGLEEVDELSEVEDIPEAEEEPVVEELEAEDLEEVDELSEVEVLSEAEEEPVVEEGPFAGMRPVEVESIEERDLEEIEEIGEAEELEAEPEGVEIVEELEAEDLEEVDELSEVEDIPGVGEVSAEGSSELGATVVSLSREDLLDEEVFETWELDELGPLGEQSTDLFVIDETALEKVDIPAGRPVEEGSGVEELSTVDGEISRDGRDVFETESEEGGVESAVAAPLAAELEEIEEAEPVDEADTEELEEIEEVEEEVEATAEYEDLEQLEEIDTDDGEAVNATEIGSTPSSFFSAAGSFGGRAFVDTPANIESAEPSGKLAVFQSDELLKGPVRVRGVENIASYHVVELDDFISVVGRNRDIIERHRGSYRIMAEAYFNEAVDLDTQLANLIDQVVNRREFGSIDDLFGDSFRGLDFADVLTEESRMAVASEADPGLRLGADGFIFSAVSETGDVGMRHVYRGLVRLTRRWDARVAVVLELGDDGAAKGIYSLGAPEECEDRLGLAATSHLVRNVMGFRRVCLLKEPLNRYQGYVDSCSAQRLTVLTNWLFLPLQSPDHIRYLVVGFPRAYEDLIDLSEKILLLSRGV